VWRVQRTWTVGSDERSYQPTFEADRPAAERAAEDLRSTLAHFPTLNVTIMEVTRAEADAELATPQPTAEAQSLHLVDDEAGVTACGIPASRAHWAPPEVFELSGIRCPDCEAAAAR
jgi:hypothetical protein